MLLKIIKNKWTYFIILGLFIFVPVGIQISQVYFGDKTPHGDWLGFWGSYLGIIPSGLIAYFVAKNQIDYQNQIENKRRQRETDLFNLEKLEEGMEYLKPWYTNVRLLVQAEELSNGMDKKLFFEFYSETKDDVDYNSIYYDYIIKISKRLRKYEDIYERCNSLAFSYQGFFLGISKYNFSLDPTSALNFDDEDFDRFKKLTESIVVDYNDLNELIKDQIYQTMQKH